MGCVSLKQKVQPQEDQVVENIDQNEHNQLIPLGFIKGIEEHSYNIVNSSKTSMDQNSNLMNSFQFFKFNSRHLWQMAINPKYSKSNINLILESTEGLLSVLPTYIKSNMTYTLFICQILAVYAKIIFQFHATNGRRFLELDTQSRYLNLIKKIEQELTIERANDLLLNNVEFELFQIQAAFTLAPTNSTEGQEILTQFLGGALKAAMTFTLNDDLLEGLKKGIIYIYNEYKKHQIKRKFELIYYITGLKYEIIQNIEKNSEIKTIIQILTRFYVNIIKDCVDWEIKCCWIKSISDIINHKIQLKPQDLQEKLFQDSLKNKQILKISSEYYVNIANISNNENANMIFQQIKQLWLLSNLQLELVSGSQDIKGFEDIYKIKLKLQSTESNALIEKSTLNSIIDRIKQQTILHQKIKEQIKCQDNNNYLNALINEQLEEILLLDQDLHQLIENKAVLSTVVAEQDDSTDYQISMINYLIDILRTNNQILQDENFKNQLSKVGISYEQKDNQMNNKNIILRLELQLKSITSGTIKTQQTKIKIFNIFSVIDQYEKVIIHNIEFLLKLQIQFDLVETIEYCDYRGLVAIINQLYLILQQIQSDKTLKIEVFQLPSKIQTQLKKQLLYFRHTNLQLEKLNQLRNGENVAEKMLNIQKQSLKIINRLITGIERVKTLIEDSQQIEDNHDNQMLKEMVELLDEETLGNYNPQKVEKIKLKATHVQQYIQSMKNQIKQNTQQNQILFELEAIEISQGRILKFKIIPEKNEKFFLLLLNDFKVLLQSHYDKQINQLTQTMKYKFKQEIDFYSLIIKNANELRNTQEQNLTTISHNSKLRSLINEHNENIKNVQTNENKYEKYIEEIKNEIQELVRQEVSIQDNLILILKNFDQLQQLISSHYFQAYSKKLESQIVFILKSIQDHNTRSKLNLFDKFAAYAEDTMDSCKWRIKQCVVYELQQMQTNLLEPQVVAVNQSLLLKLQIYETDNRIKALFQSPELIKQQTQLMEQYWPSIEEQVQKTIKDKLDLLNTIVFEIENEKQEQSKQRLQKQYRELQQEIDEELQNVSSVTSSLGITVLFLQDMKADLIRIQDTLNQLKQAVNEIGQDIRALRGKSFWDLLELRMKNVFLQMHIALAETIYIPIKTREKYLENEQEDSETNLFTDDLFGDGEVNEFIWKETKDSMLIHGLAGSGKSTSSKKIEEFIWQIYEKNQNENDIVPIVPIFVQLPTLKEPDVYAVQETLKSDNYRFNNKQIDQLKESVNQGKLRLVLIFDSYDELKQNFIGINLYNSNKLEKWRKQGDSSYPKVITTSRTEFFTSQDYYKWFISDKKQKYKEIRLIKFNDSQIQSYIDEFVSLMQKLTVKQFSVIQDSIEFVKQWRRDISSDQDLQLRLENFVAKEKLSQTKQSLELLWSAKEYRINMEKATLFDLLETPFMMEIVMQVLPKVAEQFTLGVKNKQSKQEMFTTYNFYEVFLDQYFDRQIYKLQQTENIINAKNQLWDFAQRLAIEMTIHNLSQVNFASNGLVYKKVKSDWRDQFFDDDDITGKYKRLFRQCIPLRQKLGNYSFNHKSIQEFLVAKWFIDNMDRIEEEKYYSEFNWSVWNLEWFEGIFKFIRYKTGHDELIKIKLYTILTSTQQPEQFVIAKSNSIYILQKLNFDFRGKKLLGIKIKDVNLKNINLRKCCLDFSNFENVQLSNVNLEHASLYKCKWTNLRLDEDDSINFQVGSIDKIHIGVDKIYFLNAGKIQSFNFLKKVNKFYDCCVNVLDYDILQDSDKDELIYINEDSIAYEFRSKESNLYLIPHSQKWFLGDQVKQIIKCKDDNQYHWYIINGKSLKILKFEINHNVCEVGEYCLVKCDDFKTPIAETTKLIAYKNNFILATHPGSLISLYNMKSDQIIFQNKYNHQVKQIYALIKGIQFQLLLMMMANIQLEALIAHQSSIKMGRNQINFSVIMEL